MLLGAAGGTLSGCCPHASDRASSLCGVGWPQSLLPGWSVPCATPPRSRRRGLNLQEGPLGGVWQAAPQVVYVTGRCSGRLRTDPALSERTGTLGRPAVLSCPGLCRTGAGALRRPDSAAVPSARSNLQSLVRARRQHGESSAAECCPSLDRAGLGHLHRCGRSREGRLRTSGPCRRPPAGQAAPRAACWVPAAVLTSRALRPQNPAEVGGPPQGSGARVLPEAATFRLRLAGPGPAPAGSLLQGRARSRVWGRGVSRHLSAPPRSQSSFSKRHGLLCLVPWVSGGPVCWESCCHPAPHGGALCSFTLVGRGMRPGAEACAPPSVLSPQPRPSGGSIVQSPTEEQAQPGAAGCHLLGELAPHRWGHTCQVEAGAGRTGQAWGLASEGLCARPVRVLNSPSLSRQERQNRNKQ